MTAWETQNEYFWDILWNISVSLCGWVKWVRWLIGARVWWHGVWSERPRLIFWSKVSIIQKWQIGDKRNTWQVGQSILFSRILFNFQKQMPTEILWYLLPDALTRRQNRSRMWLGGHGTILVMGKMWKTSYSELRISKILWNKHIQTSLKTYKTISNKLEHIKNGKM